METSEMEELFWQVFKCDGEDELHKIVTSNEYFKNPNNWYPYGGDDKDDKSNFKDFDNQQPRSGPALVEKITNSIDALLLKKCKQAGYEPKSRDTPRTIEEAAEQFFKIPKGGIADLESDERVEMASKNIQIIATGGDIPDLMIYDCGEGQHPDNFKDTFVSLGNNNKTDIAFVQGKYNMGSTGALSYCGEYQYQLIASKMNQKIFKKQNEYVENLFGWTLVRIHILTDEENFKYKNSWYEYFVIDGTKIPQFAISEIDIGLYEGKKFTTGALVKLFSYELEEGLRTAIHQGLYREFNQLLYKPALPFLLYERRPQYKKKWSGKKTKIEVYGNHVRIIGNVEEKSMLESPPIYAEFIDEEMGVVNMQAVLFKKEKSFENGKKKTTDRDRIKNFIGRGRNVVYVLNGQVQGVEGQSFITKKLNYDFLKDSMLIVIDCSRIKTNFRQKLFMANRYHVRQGRNLERLNKKVIEELKGNEVLRQLNKQRKLAMVEDENDSEGEKLIEDLFSKLPNNKSIADIFQLDGNIANLFTQKTKTKSEKHEQKRNKAKLYPRKTKRFPSIFNINLKEDHNGKKVKSIPLNGKGIIHFETDVEETYLCPPQGKGKFEISILNYIKGNKPDGPKPPKPPKPPTPPKPIKEDSFFEINKSGPSDGSIKLTLKPKESLNVGDEIKINARLTSPDGDLESIFYVKIAKSHEHKDKKVVKEPERPKLPQPILITKKEGEWKKQNGQIWEADGWNDDSIIHIVSESGERPIVSAIAINMSSNLLQKYLSDNRANNEKKVNYLKQQYFSKAYMHGLCLYYILEKVRSQENKYADEEVSSEDLVAKIFKDYGVVLLYLDTNKKILEALNN